MPCNTGFASAVLPGMLCASLFPAIIGSQFPGALYLTQTLNFRQAALVRSILLPCSTESLLYSKLGTASELPLLGHLTSLQIS